uniref:Uncharacterized protein n=1 Tax=Populus trichocarpa TaxID=3694 RepID=A0A3N7HE30_POPTR
MFLISLLLKSNFVSHLATIMGKLVHPCKAQHQLFLAL